MSHSAARRFKRPSDRRPYYHDEPEQPTMPTKAFVQAYEAQLVYGQHELALELASRAEDLPESSRSRGRCLLRWNGSDDGREIWADRHDIIHLLTDLPSSPGHQIRSPSQSSSSSWDSLPYDAEETFHITSPEQLEEYERRKKQAWINALREDRLRERTNQDRDQAIADGQVLTTDSWDPNEQPTDGIMTLMRHTAKSLSESPDPKVLEMRILANHAKDDRFAFLRGRYSAIWTGIKDHVRRVKLDDPSRKAKEEKTVGALLGGYDSSDEDEDEEASDRRDGPAHPPESPPPPSPPMENTTRGPSPPPLEHTEDNSKAPYKSDEQNIAGTEEEKQKERRRRAEEWKRKRVEARSSL